MIDYNLKAQIIECGLAKLESLFSKYLYIFNRTNEEEGFTYKGLEGIPLLEFCDVRLTSIRQEALSRFCVDLLDRSDYLTQEAYKVNHASYQRVKRLKDRVSSLINNHRCLFLTLTFDNNNYTQTSQETKRKYVQRCLKGLGVPYVANVDFGAKNGRLHYHAIVQIPRIDRKVWQYGNIDFKPITTKNESALSKYLDKLTSHAIKETCKGNRLLYSRNV